MHSHVKAKLGAKSKTLNPSLIYHRWWCIRWSFTQSHYTNPSFDSHFHLPPPPPPPLRHSQPFSLPPQPTFQYPNPKKSKLSLQLPLLLPLKIHLHPHPFALKISQPVLPKKKKKTNYPLITKRGKLLTVACTWIYFLVKTKTKNKDDDNNKKTESSVWEF